MQAKLKGYRSDPYWKRATAPAHDSNGSQIKPGDRVFVFPATGAVFTGHAARVASEQFELLAEIEARRS